MELVNTLPIPAFAFRQFDQEGALDCVVAARGTFTHVQDGALALMGEQEEFQWEDAYDGDPHGGVLLRQTDLTPGKPGTDVTFLGSSFAPGGRPAGTWRCSLSIGLVSKSLDVWGERFWHPVVRDRWAGFRAKAPKRVLEDWRLGEPEPATRVAITWANAYGGAVPETGDPDAGRPFDVEPRNPLGCGIVMGTTDPDAGPRRAPSLLSSDAPPVDWRDGVEPAGLGPVSPWWRARQQHAGTYDDAWLKDRHPLLPLDFDTRFWQCAPPGLVATPFLEGGEPYALENLHPDLPHASGRLPRVRLGVRLEGAGRDEMHILQLDGVHFDWRSDSRVLLTWRARFPLPDAADARLTLSRVAWDAFGNAPSVSAVGATS